MSYYLSILKKYEIFDCETFENVKKRFPDKNPAYLRKIIYLKGFKISKNGILRSITQRKGSNRIIEKKLHCPECLSNRWVWIDKHSKIMCLDCGFVGERSTFILKKQEKIGNSHPIYLAKKRRNKGTSVHEDYAQSDLLFWVEVKNNGP